MSYSELFQAIIPKHMGIKLAVSGAVVVAALVGGGYHWGSSNANNNAVSVKLNDVQAAFLKASAPGTQTELQTALEAETSRYFATKGLAPKP